MRVLALDTSTPICAVAALDGARVLAEDDRASEQRHGELLLPRIRDVLATAGLAPAALELIAVGIGPGSFTGLRTGLATAKGLALALSIPLRAVCSLRALAAGLPDAETSLRVATIDAGKGELFLAAFAGDRVTHEPALLAPQRALPAQAAEALRALAASPNGHGRTLHVCGAGARRHPELLAALGPAATLAEAAFDAPAGRNVGRLGLAAYAAEGRSDLAALAPSYLRDSDAKLPARPLTVE
jgi:tRNA threonylcarbamoyladenosine biosynthesis protein TsaB